MQRCRSAVWMPTTFLIAACPLPYYIPTYTSYYIHARVACYLLLGTDVFRLFIFKMYKIRIYTCKIHLQALAIEKNNWKIVFTLISSKNDSICMYCIYFIHEEFWTCLFILNIIFTLSTLHIPNIYFIRY